MSARTKIALLTFFFAICGTAAVITAYLQQREDANVKPSDLYAIVDRQLGDLRGGDFTRAYEYASSDIQERYDVGQFAAMVQAQYPGMTRSSRAEYGQVRTNGRHATVEAYLISPEGDIMPCVYILVREGDSWRIDGARLMQPWPPDLWSQETML
ncbi:MAG: DUF4864 domain-containing protein [Chthoniobacteraceae bacterium]|jgi:hypothetical protein